MRRHAALAAGLTLLLSACGGVAAAPSSSAATSLAPSQSVQQAQMVMGVTETPTNMPAFIALDNGIFRKYGIDMKLLSTTAPVAVAGLSSGSVQVSTFAGTIMDADPAGKNLAFLGGLQNEFAQFALYAKPSFKSIKDLAGATVAGSTPGASATLSERAILKSAGLNPDKDVKWLYAGSTAAQLAVLQNGQVDASVLSWPTYLEAQKAGFVKLADAKDLHVPAASATLSVARAWVRDNPAVAQQFLKAMIESISVTNSDKAKTEASLVSHLKVGDQASLDDAYARYTPFPNPPYITPEAVQEGIDDSPNAEVKGHKPGDYIDNQPLDAVVKSGFASQFAKPGR